MGPGNRGRGCGCRGEYNKVVDIWTLTGRYSMMIIQIKDIFGGVGVKWRQGRGTRQGEEQ